MYYVFIILKNVLNRMAYLQCSAEITKKVSRYRRKIVKSVNYLDKKKNIKNNLFR